MNLTCASRGIQPRQLCERTLSAVSCVLSVLQESLVPLGLKRGTLLKKIALVDAEPQRPILYAATTLPQRTWRAAPRLTLLRRVQTSVAPALNPRVALLAPSSRSVDLNL